MGGQHGVTYRLDPARNRARIQRLGEFRVLGLHQIPQGAEIASAVLVRRESGFYLQVTGYLPKETLAARQKFPHPVGVRDKLTLSGGLKVDFEVPETPRLNRLQRRLFRTKPGSKNREHLRHLLRREHGRIANRRRDAQNKVLAFLRRYPAVAFQEDFVKGWSASFGRQVHHSGIGGLKARLRNSLATPLPVERFERTTGECSTCGEALEVPLSARVVACPRCGRTEDRDLNAARVILRKGLGLSPNQALGVDRSEVTPMEREAAVRILGSNPWVRVSFLGEVGSPALWCREEITHQIGV